MKIRSTARLGYCTVFLILLNVFSVLGDSGNANSEAEPKRPTITGAENWKYNKFSSFDLLKINLEKEGPKGQKFLLGIYGLFYQEKDNKSWDSYVGESYYKIKKGKMDFQLGLLRETLGSGDNVSFIDKLNSRRYYAGLANDYNRDKKEVPAFKFTYYFTPKRNLTVHYLPIFEASDPPSIYSSWASSFQKALAVQVIKGATLLSESTKSLDQQYHVSYSSSFPKYEIRYHYFYFKERLPIVDMVNENLYKQTYPIDETVAIDGNVTLSKDLLVRFEMAYTKDKSFSEFNQGKVGRKFFSDSYNALFGTDKTFKNNLYFNVQTLFSYAKDLKYSTPFQLYPFETAVSVDMKKGFKNETLFVEFAGIENLSTGEFVLTPNISIRNIDSIKMTAGIQINGKSTDALGPIGQFDKNNTPYFETEIIF
ncbi:MAG: hypothetical protein HQM08_30165 [Candidatus Riflebacteria bacterium]|nr:hypothetical protein [Candidatus Riflebacteria bacterium]